MSFPRLFSVIAYLTGMTSLIAFFWLIQFRLDAVAPLDQKSLIHNSLLFLIFPLQHSILARAFWKRRVQLWFGETFERPLYVATSGIVMWAVVLNWRIFGPVYYTIPPRFLFDVLFYASLALIISCTLSLNHRRMFGLQQKPAQPETLQKTGGYGVVRHPITSLLLVALWAQSEMTASRLQFNLLFGAYALIGTFFEEKDLVARFGKQYLQYRQEVPAFVPRIKSKIDREKLKTGSNSRRPGSE